MSQNQEIIESKLCAYIDGELDPEGRAEIEKHLEANPQHRRLLESLRATRDLLRGLPREGAPPELAETLNGQLERSVLLDYQGDRLRAGRMPRVFAAAAIVALTAGLGAAVYFALPGSRKNPTIALHASAGKETQPAEPAAESNESAQPPSVETTPPVQEKAAPTPPVAEIPEEKSLPDMSAGKRVVPNASAGAIPGDQSASGLDQLAREVAQNRSMLLAAANANSNVNTATPPDAAPQLGSNAVVLLVRSESPTTEEQRLTSYLDAQRIPWKVAASSNSGGESRQRMDGPSQSRETSQSPLAKGSTQEGVLQQFAQTQPAGASQTQVTRFEQQQFTGAGASSQSIEGGKDSRTPEPGTGVLVCQMSRRQATELTKAFGFDSAQAAQANVAPSDSDSAGPATTRPAGGPTTSVAAAPADKATNLKIASADREDARMLKQAPGGNERAAQIPTSQPVDELSPQQQARRSSPESARAGHSEQQFGAMAAPADIAPAASQPAVNGPTTAPIDEPVNVVIFVESATPTAAGAPATQPAASENPATIAPETRPAQLIK